MRLHEWLLACPAWQSLDGNSRALYVEIARRYRGPNSNNGKIPFSVREAAAALHVGRDTATRCLDALMERGLIKIAKNSGFNVKGRVAREWVLTEFPDDASGIRNEASKDFMRWWETRQNSFHGPITGTHSPITGTVKAVEPDAVVKKSRLRPCGRTVSAPKLVPKSDYKDTMQTARWLRPEEQARVHQKQDDVTALVTQATNYARWLAERDQIVLPADKAGAPVWSDFKNGTASKHISAVSFGNVTVAIPNWDFDPKCVRASS